MFFSRFENIDYDNVEMKDLSTALILDPKIKENKDLFFWYQLEDWETPDTCAYDHYGNSKYNFVLLLMNDIVDPFFDWPLSYNEVVRLSIEKYGKPDIENGKYKQNGYNDIRYWIKDGIYYPPVKTYYKGMKTVVGNLCYGDGSAGYDTDKIYAVISTTGDTNGDTMTQDQNNNWTLYGDMIIPFGAIPITQLEYEEDLNDKKRNIKILYPELISQLDKELDFIFNG